MGHMNIAKEAKEQMALDKVIFIPAYIAPHKDQRELASPDHRAVMIGLTIGRQTGFEVSRFEIDRPRTSYSIETVRYFRIAYPASTEFFFLIGEDSLKGLAKWKDIDEIFKLCKFVVFNRPGSREASYPEIQRIHIEPQYMSSTQIRGNVKGLKSITGMVAPAVEEYITANNLYR